MAEWKIISCRVRDAWEPPGREVKIYSYEAHAEGFPPLFFELPQDKNTPANIEATLKVKAREVEQLIGRKVRV